MHLLHAYYHTVYRLPQLRIASSNARLVWEIAKYVAVDYFPDLIMLNKCLSLRSVMSVSGRNTLYHARNLQVNCSQTEHFHSFPFSTVALWHCGDKSVGDLKNPCLQFVISHPHNIAATSPVPCLLLDTLHTTTNYLQVSLLAATEPSSAPHPSSRPFQFGPETCENRIIQPSTTTTILPPTGSLLSLRYLTRSDEI